MKTAAIAVLTALALTGCAAPTAPAVAPTAAAPQLPPHARAVDPSVVRHLMEDGSSSTRLWGLQYDSTTPNKAPADPSTCFGAHPTSELSYDNHMNWYCTAVVSLTVNWNYSGSGKFESVGRPPKEYDKYQTKQYERFIYTVPDDQVLVINEVQGAVFINGFSVGTAGTREKVDYVFGSGEVVMFYLGEGGWLDGFSADPSLLGAGSKSVRSAK